MADPLLAKSDDYAPRYLSSRQQAQETNGLAFLMEEPGTPQAPAGEASQEPETAGAVGSAGDPPRTFERAWNNARAAAADFGKGTFIELPRAVVGGARDAIQEMLDATYSLSKWAEDNGFGLGTITIDGNGIGWKRGIEGTEITLPQVAGPDSTTGQIYHDVAQFVTGFLPGLKAARLAKVATGTEAAMKAAARVAPKAGRAATAAGRFAEGSAAGAASDAFAFDPEDERLADLIKQHTDLENPIVDYLAAAPGDSEAEARFKRALEGLGLGTLTEGLGLVVKGIRGARSVKTAPPPNAPRPAGEESTLKEVPPAAKMAGTEDAIDTSIRAELPGLGDVQKPLVSLIDERHAATVAGDVLQPDAEASVSKVNINLARLNTTDDVKEAIATTGRLFADRMDDATRGTISHEETQRLASDLGMKVEDLLSRRSGQAFNAEEALAARQILASSGEQLVGLARTAATAEASPADLLSFRRAMSLHSAIQEQVAGMTAEAGRALSAFRIMAKGTMERDRQIGELLRTSGGDLFNRDMARRLADIAAENPNALNKTAREMTRASGWEQMYEVWVNGLLSGPQTHVVNTLSNALVSLWQVPERMLASAIGRGLGNDGGVVAGEATAQAFGMVNGYRDGLKLFAKALRTGEGSDLIGKVEEAHRAFTAENFAGTRAGRAVNLLTAGSLDRGGIAAHGVNLLGEVARLPSRFLTAEDELFKAVGYRMELNAQAFRTASAEGLDGEAMARRMAEIVSNPPENIHLAAVDAARYQTFTQPLGEAGQAAQEWIRKVPGLRLVAPFVRTPTNILKFVGERTPLATLSKSIRSDIAAGGARRDLALARMGLGTMTMAVAADLTAAGHLTGGGPEDNTMRQALRNTGWQPYSVKIGDTYYSYNRLDPLGMMLGLAADTSEITGQVYGDLGEGDADNLAAAAVMSLAKNVTSKTWLTGVSNLVEAVDDPDRYGTRFLQRLGGSLIPTGIAQVNRTFADDTLRDTHGLDLWQSVINEAKSRLPGYSKELPPRTNMWGEPIVLGGGLGPDIASPIYSSEQKASPVDEEIVRLGVPLTMPRRQVGGVELTATEYHRYVELAGNGFKDPGTGLGLKDTLAVIIAGKHPMAGTYRMATDGPEGGKAQIISRVVMAYRQAAQQTLLNETPELRELVDQRQRERQRNIGG